MTLPLQNTRRRIGIVNLFNLAGHLVSDDRENREYDRGLAELLVDACGISMDYKAEVLEMIRMPPGVRKDAWNKIRQANKS